MTNAVPVAERVSQALLQAVPNARNPRFTTVVDHFLDSTILYVEYDEEGEDATDNFAYALVNARGVRLYDDGIEAIEALQGILDRRRNLFQRLSEFHLVDLIGAVIALSVTGVFVVLVVKGANVSQEFLAIFSLIAGYYFGKNVSGGGTT